MIRIRSKKAGFRRCGIAHPAAWTEYREDAFTEEQLAALQAEPMLQVEIAPETERKAETELEALLPKDEAPAESKRAKRK